MSDKAKRALHSSKVWLQLLIKECEIEPADCRIQVRLKGPTSEEVSETSLLDALKLIDEVLSETG